MSNTNFPTSVDTATNPTSSNTLNSPSHSAQHSFENDAILALEAKVGADSSAVTTSFDYKLSGVTGTDKAASKTGTETLTNKTLGTGTKTSVGSDATGDVYYRDSGGNFQRLPIGTAGQILDVSSGGIPEWIANPAANNASASVKGVSQLATSSQINSGTATGSTGAALVVTPDQLAASNYITSSALATTPIKFGGNGADGALSITSGTTTIDLASAAIVEKNYTSISITGTGALAFTNPNAGGTIIILRSQGAVTITSSAAATVDVRSLGAAAASNASGFLLVANTGSNNSTTTGGNGGAVNSNFNLKSVQNRFIPLLPGAGGGSNGTNAGGRGAGALLVECGGALNFGASSTINAAGTVGATSAGAGGGGGGAGGSVVILYNNLTANAGTITLTGGVGGAGNGVSGGGGGGANRVAGARGADSNSAPGSTGSNDDGNGGAGGTGNGGGGGGAGGWKIVAANTYFA